MISNRCLYALRAVLELSLRHRQGPLTIGQIADAQKIPVRFLEAILRQLKHDGIANSVRGKEGGYYLAREPRTISVGEVIRLFEGPLVAVSKSEETSDTAEIPDIFDGVWKAAEQALANVYDHTDFGTLAELQQVRANIKATDYSI